MGFFDGGIGALGGILGGLGSHFTNQQNARAIKEANEAQMNFQREMSSTAHQRQVADMRAAGLNPILSAMGGSGAQSGTGSANAPVMENALGQGVSSALESTRLKKDLAATDSQIALNDAAEGTQKTQAQANVSSAKAAEANAAKATADAKAVRVATKAAEAQLPAQVAQSRADLQKSRFNEKAATYDSILDRAAGTVGAITNALGGGIRSFFKGASGQGGHRPRTYPFRSGEKK